VNFPTHHNSAQFQRNSALKTRLKYDIKILNVPYDLINYVLGFKAFKNALSFVFVFVLILHHKAVRSRN
jgi:hypothetical protein